MPFLTPALGLALTLAMLIASCGGDSKDNDEVTAGDSTTTTSAPTTTEPPTTTTSAPTTAPTTAVDATDDPRCEDPGVQSADVDGDGTDDRVLHIFAGSDAVLRLCASSVGYQELPGLGQAQHLDLADIEQDGRVEIFYGATSAGFLGVQLAVVVDGSLSPVSDSGEPLVLYDGYPDGLEGARHDFGCGPSSDGGRTLFTKRYDFAAGTFDSSEWAIDGTVATLVSTGVGQADFLEPPSSVPSAAENLIDPC